MIEDKNQVNKEDFAGIANQEEEEQNFAEKYLVNKTGTLIEKKDISSDNNKFYAETKPQQNEKKQTPN